MITAIEKNKFIILIAMVCCMAMIFLDQTALPLALHLIKNDLKITLMNVQWIINAYLLATLIFLIFGGKLADTVGNKIIFNIGCLIFLFGSLGCGIAQNFQILLISRMLQGIGAALLLPPSATLLINAFDFSERGKAMGIYISSASLFLAFGPVIGGILVQYIGWRSIFLVNLPLMILVIILINCANINEDKSMVINKKLDVIGFLLFCVIIIPLIVSILDISFFRYHYAEIVISLATSMFALFVFIKYERHIADPFLDITLFHSRPIRTSIYFMMFTQATIISIAFWPYLFTIIFHLKPNQIGYLLLFVTTPALFISPLAGILQDKYGPRIPTLIGCICILLGSCYLGIFINFHEYYCLIPGLFIYGCGPCFILTTIMTYLMNSVTPSERSIIAGITGFFRQFGGTLCYAVLSVMMLVTLEKHSNTMIIFNSISSFVMLLLPIIGLSLICIKLCYKLPNHQLQDITEVTT